MAMQPVFDFFPRGTPLIMHDEMTAAMHASLDAGHGAATALDAIENAQVDCLRNDPTYADRLREAYATAGVNLVSATMGSYDPSLAYPEGVRQDIARWRARIDALPYLHAVTDPAHARDIVSAGDVGVVMNVQNGGLALEGSVDEVDVLEHVGVRVFQLTYNDQNLVGTGCTERHDGGLSNHGVAVIERLNDRGVIVDTSHCGRQTTLDAIEVSTAPVAITHAFCGALADHDRAKSDEELDALAASDGYIGILAVPFFLQPGSDDVPFDTFFDHIEYAVDRIGIDRVGIGTDWGSWTPELPDPLHDGIKHAFQQMGFREEHGLKVGEGFGPLQSYEDWQAIPRGLEERGYTDVEIAGILGENFLAFWDRVTDRG